MVFQERVTNIGNKLAKITKDLRMIYCYLCHKEVESIAHVLSGCYCRRGDYIRVHDAVGIVIYQAILKKYEIIKKK